MNSLSILYSQLFEINFKNEKLIADIEITDYFTADLPSSIEENFSFYISDVTYFIVIHLLDAILISILEAKNYRIINKTNGENYLNDLLSEYFISKLVKDSNFTEIKISFYNLIIKINKKDIQNLERLCKDKIYLEILNNNLYFDLIELQNYKIDIEGKKLNIQKNNSRKKKFGQVYTRPELTEFLTNVLHDKYLKSLDNLSVLDPSCGPGLFLLASLKNFVKRKDCFNQITLFGIDIDYKSLLTSSLILKIANLILFKDNNSYHYNLKQRDFLLDTVVLDNSLNLIIGNPPYIRERFFDKNYRKKLSNYQTYKGKSDLYFAFIERAYDLLEENGLLAYIMPRYWIESDFGKYLREFIVHNFNIKLLIDFRNYKIFEKGVHSVILILEKSSKNKAKNNQSFEYIFVKEESKNENLKILLAIIKHSLMSSENKTEKLMKYTLKQQNLGINWILHDQESVNLFTKLQSQSTLRLNDVATIKEGINTGADKVSKKHVLLNNKFQTNLKDGIFVLNDDELEKLSIPAKESEIYIKKWIKGKNVKRWIVKSQENWLIYYKDLPDEETIIYRHLKKYKEILENRAEIKRNKHRNWLELAWPRDKNIFDTIPKILIPYKAKFPFAVLDDEGYYTSADFRVLTARKPYNIYVITGILNSNVIKWFLKKSSKKLGSVNDYYSYNLRKVPINYPEKELETKIAVLVKEIITNEKNLNKSKRINEKQKELNKKLELDLNKLINRLYNLTAQEKKQITIVNL